LSAAEGHAVVIGGGLLGLEAAHGLYRRGLGVTVVHLMPWLMERQLDREAGDLLREELGRRGLAFELEAVSEAIVGDGKVEGLRLQDGRTRPLRSPGDGRRHSPGNAPRRRRRHRPPSRHRRRRSAPDLGA
ncbi:MAG: NAD-binding protein, partial [Rhizobiales bacterium]|nr:NAD-binding protein [Hyphomicrobiales bacterium]